MGTMHASTAAVAFGEADIEAPDSGLERDVLAGLGQARKTIPSKYLYDAEGSRLFDGICEAAEYYPTRTETAILAERAGEIAELAGPDAVLVEFGAGSTTKVRLILDALERPAACLPIDISGEHLHAAARALAADYPRLAVAPVVADFTRRMTLPATPGGGRRLGFFPGSTIGNFTPDDAEAFLREAARTLGAGAGMVIGVDLRKDPAVLEAAYDDAAGVTAAFNRNLLVRLNRDLGAGFDLDAFAHRAVYNPELGRVEMHLVSLRDQEVTLAGQTVSFAAGETIHTENSYKYTLDGVTALAERAGWSSARRWTDPDALFSVHFLTL